MERTSQVHRRGAVLREGRKGLMDPLTLSRMVMGHTGEGERNGDGPPLGKSVGVQNSI